MSKLPTPTVQQYKLIQKGAQLWLDIGVNTYTCHTIEQVFIEQGQAPTKVDMYMYTLWCQYLQDIGLAQPKKWNPSFIIYETNRPGGNRTDILEWGKSTQEIRTQFMKWVVNL